MSICKILILEGNLEIKINIEGQNGKIIILNPHNPSLETELLFLEFVKFGF